MALDLSSITGLFVGAHVLLAAKTGVPELAINADEGAQFMRAAQNVMRHYSVQTTQKAMDWISFAGVSAMIYVPRVVALANNHSKPAQRVVGNQPSYRDAAGAVTGGPVVQTVETAPPPNSPMEAAFAANMVVPEHDG